MSRASNVVEYVTRTRTIRLETPHEMPVMLSMEPIYSKLRGVHIVADLTELISTIKRIKTDKSVNLLKMISNIQNAIDEAHKDLDEIYEESGERWDNFMQDCQIYCCYVKALYDIKLPIKSWTSVRRR